MVYHSKGLTDEVNALYADREVLREQLAQMKAGYEDARTEQVMGEEYIVELKAQLAEAQADPECFVCADCGPLVKADEDGLCAYWGTEVVIQPTLEALARPGVKQVIKEQRCQTLI